MPSDIYKTPLSDLDSSWADARQPKSALKYLVLAFFTSPLISTFTFAAIFFWSQQEIQTPQYAIGLLIVGLPFTYAVVLVFGLPLHWALGVAEWRKSYIYLVVGAAIPFVVGFLFGMLREPLLLLAISAKGAFCWILFWFFAVYLYEKKPHNKRMKSDPAKLGR